MWENATCTKCVDERLIQPCDISSRVYLKAILNEFGSVLVWFWSWQSFDKLTFSHQTISGHLYGATCRQKRYKCNIHIGDFKNVTQVMNCALFMNQIIFQSVLNLPRRAYKVCCMKKSTLFPLLMLPTQSTQVDI